MDLKFIFPGVVEMAHQLIELAALAEDPGSIPSTPVAT